MGARSSPGAGKTIHAAVASLGQGAGTAKLCVVRTRSRPVVPALVAASLAGSVLLAGCSGASTTGSASSGASAPTSGSTAPASSSTGAATDTEAGPSAPPFPADVKPDVAAASADSRVTVT